MCLWGADAPQQPLPFSHKQHAGTMKLPCKMCHTNPDPGEMMTIVAASVCMQCHSAIKPIEKLTAAAKENKEIPWVRVYQIPAYVDFSHRGSPEASATCEDCHGKVAERDQLSKEGDISMGALHEMPPDQEGQHQLQILPRADVGLHRKLHCGTI